MSAASFPYGNDLSYPDGWAGFANTKSQSWLVGYHSGVSLIIGAHTFLFFGRESLTACVASFIGAGASATYGLSKAAKSIERSGGKSLRSPHAGGASEQLEWVETGKDAKDVYDLPTAGDELDSAFKIYQALSSQQNGLTASNPFSVNDLDFKFGWVSGANVDVAIGAATYYLVEAKGLFADVPVFNVKGEATLIGASIGLMPGFWRIKKFYSLWNELAHSKYQEYPFQGFNVHPFFREWKSEEYYYQRKIDLFERQDKIIRKIKDEMISNPGKFGYPNESYALQRVVQMTKEFQDGGRSPENNPFLSWVPFEEKHIFYGDK